jgi:hypothetical protein
VKHSVIFAALAVSIGGALRSPAQQAVSSAVLSGYVEDASGAAVASIAVLVRNLDRNQTAGTQTDPQGRYRFLYLAPGNYELKVEDARFVLFSRTLSLANGQVLSVPVRLTVSGQSTSILVTDSIAALETLRSQVSEIVRPKEIDSLPLNGRNYLDLALLVPGVSRTNTGAPQQFAETSAVPGTGISFAGQRNLNNSFVLDGLSVNDDAAGLAGTFFSQEVIREFQAVNSGGTAEFGRASSGVINITSKAGTNAWHGRMYGFLRNQRFDARNALATRKDPLTQSQYGATLGGPIRRDRSFVFSNFEQTRRNAAGFVTIAPGNVAAINGTLDAVGYRGPRIGTGEYSTGYDTANFFARADHQINASHQLMARYSLYDIASHNARSAGGLSDVSRGTRLGNRDQTIALSEVAALSPRSLNELRFQFTRSRLSAPGNDTTGPAVNVAGVANFGASTTSPVGRDNSLYELNDGVSLSRGSHSLRLGADFLWNRLNISFPGSQIAGVYAFSSLANFQSARYQTFQQAFGNPNQFQSNPNAGLFVQEEWKARPDLTLQAGLRYDIQKLPAPIRTDLDNLAPRFGIAWSPGDQKTAVRAGYGMFYDRIPLRATSNALQRDGTRYRTALLSFGQAGAPAFPQQLTAFPPGQFTNITTIDFGIENSYSHQASIQVERQFGTGLFVSAGYQWLRALHLILSRNVNVPRFSAAEAAALGIPNLGRPDSRFGNVGRYEGSGDSYYNGFLLSLRARPAKTAELRISYNLSKAIDNVGNFFFSTPQDNFNLRDDRGLSDNDQRHRLAVSTVLDSPVTGAGLAARLLTGWQLSLLFLYTSELPFNVQLGFDRNNDTSLNDRPAGVARNTGRGFDFASADARLSRVFKLADRWSVQAIAETFNSLNRVNRALPNNIFGPNPTPLPAFGRATAVNDPRQLQLAIRVNF